MGVVLKSNLEESGKNNLKQTNLIKNVHRIFGLIIYIIARANIAIGCICVLATTTLTLFYIYCGLSVLAFITLEIYTRFYKNRRGLLYIFPTALEESEKFKARTYTED